VKTDEASLRRPAPVGVVAYRMCHANYTAGMCVLTGRGHLAVTPSTCVMRSLRRCSRCGGGIPVGCGGRGRLVIEVCKPQHLQEPVGEEVYIRRREK
jgi:DNA-binding IclR family transcriptional regulator